MMSDCAPALAAKQSRLPDLSQIYLLLSLARAELPRNKILHRWKGVLPVIRIYERFQNTRMIALHQLIMQPELCVQELNRSPVQSTWYFWLLLLWVVSFYAIVAITC
jgi:hypothetical protein